MRIFIAIVILTLLAGCQTTGKAAEQPEFTLPLSNLDKVIDAETGEEFWINKMAYTVQDGEDHGEGFGTVEFNCKPKLHRW